MLDGVLSGLATFPLLARLWEMVQLIVQMLPWIGTGVLVYIVLDQVRGDALLATLRSWIKSTKAVVSDQNNRLDRIETALAKLVESQTPKV